MEEQIKNVSLAYKDSSNDREPITLENSVVSEMVVMGIGKYLFARVVVTFILHGLLLALFLAYGFLKGIEATDAITRLGDCNFQLGLFSFVLFFCFANSFSSPETIKLEKGAIEISKRRSKSRDFRVSIRYHELQHVGLEAVNQHVRIVLTFLDDEDVANYFEVHCRDNSPEYKELRIRFDEHNVQWLTMDELHQFWEDLQSKA